MAISAELKRIYASAPSDVTYVETLELGHPEFTQTYFLNNDIADWDFTLEDGTIQRFRQVPFELRLPRADDQGRQDLQIAIGNVGRELMDELERAILQPQNPIACTYRVFLNQTNSTVQNDPALQLSILSVDVTTESVNATASRADVLNKAFPSNVYRLDEFPGLDR